MYNELIFGIFFLLERDEPYLWRTERQCKDVQGQGKTP